MPNTNHASTYFTDRFKSQTCTRIVASNFKIRILMNLDRLEQILDRAASSRITVIGDLMLDEFVWGRVGRISPEAPVPVVEVTGESFYPGRPATVPPNLPAFFY